MKFKTLALAVAVSIAMTGMANAAYTINVIENGNRTIATGSGSVNVSALTRTPGDYSGNAYLNPGSGIIGVGIVGSYLAYNQITGPLSFGDTRLSLNPVVMGGTGILIFGTIDESLAAYTGSQFSSGLLAVPEDYVSGSEMGQSYSTFSGSFIDLGLTAGTYLYTWGSGASADSVTVNIGPIASAVPEPATWMLMLAGFGLTGAAMRRRRPAAAPLALA